MPSIKREAYTAKVDAMRGVMRTETHALKIYSLQIGRIKNLSNKRWTKLVQQPAKFEKLKAQLSEDYRHLMEFGACLNTLLLETKPSGQATTNIASFFSRALHNVMHTLRLPNVSKHFRTWLARRSQATGR